MVARDDGCGDVAHTEPLSRASVRKLWNAKSVVMSGVLDRSPTHAVLCAKVLRGSWDAAPLALPNHPHMFTATAKILRRRLLRLEDVLSSDESYSPAVSAGCR